MFAPSRFGCRSVPALTASSPRSAALISVSGRSLCLTPSKPIRWSPRPTFWWGRKMKMTTIFNPACDKYVVIMYHYIFDERPDRRGMHPRAPADFEREVDFLTAHYQVVGTPLEVLAAGPPLGGAAAAAGCFGARLGFLAPLFQGGGPAVGVLAGAPLGGPADRRPDF